MTLPSYITQWSQYIQQAASQFNVNPYLIAAVIARESTGNATVVSPPPNPGYGLMQLTTQGFINQANSMGGVLNPWANIYTGTQYLAGLLQHFGSNVLYAIGAYNLGQAGEDYNLAQGYSADTHTTDNYATGVAALAQQFQAAGGLGPVNPGMLGQVGGSVGPTQSTPGWSLGPITSGTPVLGGEGSALQGAWGFLTGIPGSAQNAASGAGSLITGGIGQVEQALNLPGQAVSGIGDILSGVTSSVKSGVGTLGKWVLLLLIGIAVFVLLLHLLSPPQTVYVPQGGSAQ